MKHIIAIFLVFISCFSVLAQVKIEMQETNGVYEVPCEVNGLRLKFIFDTGASNVSLSLDMAVFMLENDYLNENDIYDIVNIVQADGTTYEAYKVILRTVNIGGFILNNVDCVITPYQNAPLLLGQSAIQKLGKIAIKDNFLIIDKAESNYVGLEKDIAILGLTQGTSYDECYDRLSEKYGDENILEHITNEAIETLTIEDVYFIGQHFDAIEFFFDDNGLLNSVYLRKMFPKSKIHSALKMKHELYDFLSKKYTSVSDPKKAKNYFAWYGLGYEAKDDAGMYPIRVGMTEGTTTTQQGGEKPITSSGYIVQLYYWPANYENLLEEHPNIDDY